MSDLDSILSGEEPSTDEDVKVEEAPKEEVTQETEEKKEEESSEDPPKEEEKPEETEEETTTSEDDPKTKMVPLAAVQDERRKRQEAQKRAEELESKLAQTGEEEKKTPDVFEDQDAFVDSIRNESRQEIAATKIQLAREMMMEFHDDYEDMENAFIEHAKDNPILADQARKASNPARFVYEQAKKLKDFEEMQDVSSFKEKMRAELRKELEEEKTKKEADQAKKGEDLTPSLTNVRSSGSDKHEEVTLDTLFES